MMRTVRRFLRRVKAMLKHIIYSILYFIINPRD